MKLIAQEGQGDKKEGGVPQAAITPSHCIPGD